MFLLAGLFLMGMLGLVFLASTVGALKLFGKGKATAVGTVLPALLIGGLSVGGIEYGNWKAEASPEALCQEVFGSPPPPAVSNLRGYKDDDELSPMYLGFNAPPSVVAGLVAKGFMRSGSAPQDWRFLPSWFDTSTSSSTQFGSLRNRFSQSGDYILMVDPPLKRVRVYFSSPASAINCYST